MSTSPANSKASLRDVLYELAVAAEPPTAAVLDDLVRRHPEHAAALTEMAIELALGAAGDDGIQVAEGDAVSPMTSRAMSRFQNRLYQIQAKRSEDAVNAAVAPNPLAGLDRAALRSAAQHLGVNTAFIIKLRDGHIDAGTIPRRFSEEVAAEVKAPLDVVIASFGAGPRMHGTANFKADKKPEAGGQQTFEEAVRGSGLTPEQQARLLGL